MIIQKMIASLLFLSSLLSNTAGVNYTNQAGLKDSIYTYTHKKELLSTKFEGVKSDYVWNEKDEFDISKTAIVEKEKDKDFKVLIFSDVHFSDFHIQRAIEENHEIITMYNLVKKTKPDLILVLGDIVCERSTVHAIKRFTDVMEGFNTPWAPVFGNHDDEGNCDLNYLADIMMNSPHCLMQKGDASMGVGNYIVNVVEKGSKNIIESFIMMDSHHNAVNELQMKWFKWAAEGIKKYSDNKAEISICQHIPIPEYQYAIDQLEINKMKKVIGKDAFGRIGEPICCERDLDGNPVQRGFFDIIKSTENTKFFFVGHEHLNNFSVMYDGVRLTYNTKCGTNSGSNLFINGGTLLTLSDSGIKSITQKSRFLFVDYDLYTAKIDK